MTHPVRAAVWRLPGSFEAGSHLFTYHNFMSPLVFALFLLAASQAKAAGASLREREQIKTFAVCPSGCVACVRSVIRVVLQQTGRLVIWKKCTFFPPLNCIVCSQFPRLWGSWPKKKKKERRQKSFLGQGLFTSGLLLSFSPLPCQAHTHAHTHTCKAIFVRTLHWFSIFF